MGSTVGGRPRCGAGSRAGTCVGTRSARNFPIPGLVQDSRFRGEKSRKLVKIQEQEDSILEKSIICLIRVRGFPLRDILSLRALGDGLGQGRKIVGAPPPSASFSQMLGLVRKSYTKRCFVKNLKSASDLVKENSLIYKEFT